MFIVTSVILFIVLREFFLWYWRVNKIADNQEIQIKLLEEIKFLLHKTIKKEQKDEQSDLIRNYPKFSKPSKDSK